MLNSQEVTSLISIYPFRIRTVSALFVVTMYNYHPRLLAKSNIEKQYFSHRVNDVCNGSPSRIRRVLLISFGMTILPRSSYCVKQVQKIFVMPQKALKYKRFSAFGTFTNCQFLADPSCYFRDKIRHFLCSCEKVIKLPNNFDCLVVGDKHSINCVVHYLFESFIVH